MRSLITLIIACSVSLAQAQSLCSSDGQLPPTALTERFISADCEACWRAPEDQQQRSSAGTLVLDWIVPGRQGDDAPLSAAAVLDALERLQMLHAATPSSWLLQEQKLAASSQWTMRVAHGPALANYMGASIALTPTDGGPWTAVLLLVEQIPALNDGTPIDRNLVRNMLVIPWDLSTGRSPFYEARPMSLPQGTQAGRVQAVGWVQDARGGIVALAQTACEP